MEHGSSSEIYHNTYEKFVNFHTNLETPLIGIIAPGFEDVIPDLESYRWDSIGYANSSYSNYTDI